MGLKWSIQRRQMNALQNAFKREFEGFTEQMARRGRKMVQQSIYAQTGAWRPLTRAYKQAKIRRGLDPRILMATKQYVNSIEARQQNKNTWVIAPGPNQFKLGMWLEYGTRKMPRRPHFAPVRKQLLKLMAEETKKKLARVQKADRADKMHTVARS